MRTAKLNLDWTLVRAPISGRISRAEVTAGNVVQGGAPTPTLLTTIVSLDPVYVYFEGDEQAYLRYNQLARDGTRASSRNVRNPVRMGLANEAGFPHTGYVDFVDNQLNPNTGTIRARAVFSNKDRFFTPGLFARIQLLGSGKFDAVLVQDGAIGTDQDRKFVYVLKPDSTVEYRGVELGPHRRWPPRRPEGRGTPGENVVINGLQRIRPGMKVTADHHDHGAVRLRPDCAARLVMRFSRFFIDRPIFAAVLSIVILLAGIIVDPGAPDLASIPTSSRPRWS